MDLVHVEKSHDGKLRFPPQQQHRDLKDGKKSKKKSKILNKAGNDATTWPNNYVNNVNYESDGEAAAAAAVAGQGSSKNKDGKRKNKDSKGHHGPQTDKKNQAFGQTHKSKDNAHGPESAGFGNRKNQQRIYNDPVSTSQTQGAILGARKGYESQFGNQNVNIDGQRLQNNSPVIIAPPLQTDFGSGFSVFVGKDLFTKYPSQHLTLGSLDVSGSLQKSSMLRQVFHGKQSTSLTKTDLLQAKRESRALRKAKQTQIKKGKFEDAFCMKALDNCENVLIDQLIQSTLSKALTDNIVKPANVMTTSVKNGAYVNFEQPRLETPEKVKSQGNQAQLNQLAKQVGIVQQSNPLQIVESSNDENAKGYGQPIHEILSGNSLNIFANGQDGIDTLDIQKKDSYSYRTPLEENKMQYVPESAAAVAACQAATLNNFYKNPLQQQQLSMKSYLPSNLKDNLRTGVTSTSGCKSSKPRRLNDMNAQGGLFVMHPLSAPGRKVKRTQQAAVLRGNRAQTQYGYTHADLDNIQKQIRQQVEYQKLLKEQNLIKNNLMDFGQRGTIQTQTATLAEGNNMSAPVEQNEQLGQDQAQAQHTLGYPYGQSNIAASQALQNVKDDKRILYSASKQKFNIRGPILKQSKFDKRGRGFMEQRKVKPRGASRQKLRQLGMSDASEGRRPGSNNNGGMNNELLSSLDFNDQSDINQMSILAVSQGNIYTQSAHESNQSHLRARGRSENPTGKRNLTSNKYIRDRDPKSQGNSRVRRPGDDNIEGQNINSTNKGRSISMNSKNSRKSGNSSQQRDHHSKIQARFQDKDQDRYLRSFNAEKQTNVKIKRAQTEKQEHADRVIEEGSDDDNSFASDTPSRVKHKNIANKMDDFNQAMNRMQRSPEAQQHDQKPNSNLEASPGLGAGDSMSNCNDLGRDGIQNRAFSQGKQQSGNAMGLLQEGDSNQKQAWLNAQQARKAARVGAQGQAQQIGINRAIYNKNLLHNRAANLGGSNTLQNGLPGLPPAKAKNSATLKRKKQQPKIHAKFQKYAEVDAVKIRGQSPTTSNSQFKNLSQESPELQEHQSPMLNEGPNTENFAYQNYVSHQANMRASGNQFEPRNSAQQLRQKVSKSRRCKNPAWGVGGQSQDELIDIRSNIAHMKSNTSDSNQCLVQMPASQHGYADDLHVNSNVTLNLAKQNPTLIQGMLMGGPRGSVPITSGAKKYNKMQMKIDKNKFQKIARPYIMSATTAKSGGIMCNRGGAQQYTSQQVSQMNSVNQIHQKNQMLHSSTNAKTISAGEMAGTTVSDHQGQPNALLNNYNSHTIAVVAGQGGGSAGREIGDMQPRVSQKPNLNHNSQQTLVMSNNKLQGGLKQMHHTFGEDPRKAQYGGPQADGVTSSGQSYNKVKVYASGHPVFSAQQNNKRLMTREIQQYRPKSNDTQHIGKPHYLKALHQQPKIRNTGAFNELSQNTVATAKTSITNAHAARGVGARLPPTNMTTDELEAWQGKRRKNILMNNKQISTRVSYNRDHCPNLSSSQRKTRAGNAEATYGQSPLVTSSNDFDLAGEDADMVRQFDTEMILAVNSQPIQRDCQ